MKKFTSILVVAAMLATMLVAVFPVTASAAWDGSSVSTSLTGSGTENDPWLIYSESDLAYVAKTLNENTNATIPFTGEYIKLMADLDLGNQAWPTIGNTKTNPFQGHFDGDNHMISGLSAKTGTTDSNELYAGLFGRINDGTVKNLTIEVGTLQGYKYVGAVCGEMICTPGTGYSAIINCHVVGGTYYGVQVGGMVGRSNKTDADVGQMVIIGCSSTGMVVNQVNPADFVKDETKNHFVGGIAGCAGSTIVTGCSVKDFTCNLYATSFASAGGIVGILGVSGCRGADLTNSYAINVNINILAGSAEPKSSAGGIIGKSAHVASQAGAIEYDFYNCFVSGVKITNATGSIRTGIIVGEQADDHYCDNIYYTHTEGLNTFGEDVLGFEYPYQSIDAVSVLTPEILNKGNSTAVWVSDVIAGHPVIDVDAAIANQPTYVDYRETGSTDETTAGGEETTKAPEDTTKTPEETTGAPTAEETTAAPTVADTTKAPETTNAPESGCGGVIAGSIALIALFGSAVVFKKRK